MSAKTEKANGTVKAEKAEKAPPTDIEIAIAKFEARLAEKKHIDAKDLGLGFIFPLLRKLAQASGDQEEQLSDLADELSSLLAEEGDEAIVEAFERSWNTLLKGCSLIDKLMVVSGFYEVSTAGLKATDKIPAELRQEYESFGAEAQQTGVAIESAVTSLKERALDDDGDDDDDDDDDDVEEETTAPTSVTPAGTVAPVVEASVEAPAAAPTTEGGTNAA